MGFGSYELKGVWIYNSRPVVLILRWHDFDSYWIKIETYEALKEYAAQKQIQYRNLQP